MQVVSTATWVWVAGSELCAVLPLEMHSSVHTNEPKLHPLSLLGSSGVSL